MPLTVESLYRADLVSTEPSAVLVMESVQGGFPSPAQGFYLGRVDLNAHLIKDRTSTYVIRVSGDSMEGAGISSGDEVIVDRSIEPRHGHVVIAVLDGELTVKRLLITRRGVVLSSENPNYPDITVPTLSELTIWGVVTRSLHHV